MSGTLLAQLVDGLLPQEVGVHLTGRAQRAAIVEVELAVLDVLAARGDVPPQAARTAREVAARLDLDGAGLLAATLRVGRPVKPVVDALEEVLPRPAAAWLHPGLTTQDVLDTANAVRWTRAAGALRAEWDEAIAALADAAEATADLLMVGRTNGLPAAPLTLGFRLARHLDAWLRHRERLVRAASGLATAQLGGAVGLARPWGRGTDAVHSAVAERLGLSMPEIAWHVERDRLTEAAFALERVAAAARHLGAEVMDLGATGEVVERGPAGTGESSAMPHKRNPRLSEQLVAVGQLARTRLSDALAGAEHQFDRAGASLLVEGEAMDDLFRLCGAAASGARALAGRLQGDGEAAGRALAEAGPSVLSEAYVVALGPAVGFDEARRRVRAAFASGAGPAGGDLLREAGAGLSDDGILEGIGGEAAWVTARVVARARGIVGGGAARLT